MAGHTNGAGSHMCATHRVQGGTAVGRPVTEMLLKAAGNEHICFLPLLSWPVSSQIMCALIHCQNPGPCPLSGWVVQVQRVPVCARGGVVHDGREGG